MDFNEKRKARWIKLYNSIACLGILCVIIPYFELAAHYATYQHATVVSVILTPILIAIGFSVRKLLMQIQKIRTKSQDLESSYDIDIKKTSRISLIISMIISGVIAAILGASVGSKIMESVGPLYSNDFGVPVLTLSCVAVSAVGSVLATLKFYQFLSIRTVIEYIAAFTFLFGLQTFWGNGVSFVFIICLMVFFLCLALCMNQENIVKVEYMHKTCYASNKMRRTGMKGVIGLWLFAVLLQIVLLSACAIIRALFLVIAGRPWEFILNGPIEGYRTINIVLLSLGGILTLIGIVLMPIFLRTPYMSEVRAKIKQHFIKLKASFLSLIIKILKIESKKRADQNDEINPIYYSDFITYRSAKRHKAVYTKYKDFNRALKTISDKNKQYLFAYRVLIESFFRMDIGLNTSQTPFEMALIIKEKTNLEGIEEMTGKYINVAYAEKTGIISDNDMAEICDILRDRL